MSGGKKIRKWKQNIKKLPTEVAEPKTTERSNTCFERFSEIPHAYLTVTPCNDLAACQINAFFQLSVLVFFTDTKCFIKTSFSKSHIFPKTTKKQE